MSPFGKLLAAQTRMSLGPPFGPAPRVTVRMRLVFWRSNTRTVPSANPATTVFLPWNVMHSTRPFLVYGRLRNLRKVMFWLAEERTTRVPSAHPTTRSWPCQASESDFGVVGVFEARLGGNAPDLAAISQPVANRLSCVETPFRHGGRVSDAEESQRARLYAVVWPELVRLFCPLESFDASPTAAVEGGFLEPVVAVVRIPYFNVPVGSTNGEPEVVIVFVCEVGQVRVREDEGVYGRSGIRHEAAPVDVHDAHVSIVGSSCLSSIDVKPAEAAVIRELQDFGAPYR